MRKKCFVKTVVIQDPLEHVLASDLSGPPSPAPIPSSSQTSNMSRDTSTLSVSNAANATTPLYANLHPDTQVNLTVTDFSSSPGTSG